ncbi:hypothetical protein MPH_08867 [Macrophomina phaseolina MS6]|uniref:Uncharacterized protein n=1 Tax=Macrophomina phaseolina (strain MS6) TaxID=1126212 RepID=K2RHE0_MACPH|nr:hypothetical protein MPH_08867 [Macrophomina phaseolina MS6]
MTAAAAAAAAAATAEDEAEAIVAGHVFHQQSPSVPHQGTFGISDARSVVVHSAAAAALFRQPSTSSAAKKHTRPPMSKLFASLQLTPENFLRLQAAAKAYMLDEAHPERQSCVGSRGKGDTDMVKLRLFNCCRDFLNDGIGDRYFGPDVPAPTENEVLEGETTPGRKWVWPRDGNKIVSLVTPLLRRMVTNERQRQYAQETRKGTGKKKDGTAGESSHDAATAATPSTPFDAHGSPPNPAIDPSLGTPQSQAVAQDLQKQQQQQHPETGCGPPPTQYPRFLKTQPPSSIYTAGIPPNNLFHHPQPPPDQNVIQVLITKNNTKLLPRIDMPSWPSTPHHTLPLAALRKAVEDEIRGLLKRGLDLGMKRKSVRPVAGELVSQQRPGSRGQGASGGAMDGEEDVLMGGDGQNTASGGQNNDGDGKAQANNPDSIAQQLQQQQQQQTPTPAADGQDEPSLEGIALEVRALTGRGLVLVTGEDEWHAILAETGQAVWMEGVLRVVVEVI